MTSRAGCQASMRTRVLFAVTESGEWSTNAPISAIPPSTSALPTSSFMAYIGRRPAGDPRAEDKAKEFGGRIIRHSPGRLPWVEPSSIRVRQNLSSYEYEAFPAIRKWSMQFIPRTAVGQRRGPSRPLSTKPAGGVKNDFHRRVFQVGDGQRRLPK